MLRKIFLSLFIVLPFAGFCQAKKSYTINGTIKDEKTGEILIGATISLQRQPVLNTLSNAYGFYSLSAEEGSYTMLISFSGFETDSQTVILNGNITINVALKTVAAQLEE